jgi:leucine dehydrogenase
MTVFSTEAFADHEQVVFVSNAETGLRAIIAIHDTALGPAIGGCRMYPYASEEDALRDVLRLARGMTYKAAAANLDYGGGKAVIIGDPRTEKSPELLQAMGAAVERLAGRYYTAEDVGTTVADFGEVRKTTRYVVGLPEDLGGTGDPSPTTALGVFVGLKAAARHKWGSEDLSGKTVAVQGLGNVGWHLCGMLDAAGANLIVTDINAARTVEAAEKFGAKVVAPDEIYGVEADIFAPCAMGAVINDETVEALKVEIVGGAANNQLARHEHGVRLSERGILYAPDFVINAGGMMRVASEIEGFDEPLVDRRVQGIGDTLAAIFKRSDADGIPTEAAAMEIAEDRLKDARARNAATLAA